MSCNSEKCHCPKCVMQQSHERTRRVLGQLGERLIDSADCDAVAKAATECAKKPVCECTAMGAMSTSCAYPDCVGVVSRGRCRCDRCLAGEDKFFYTVKPFEWARSGYTGSNRAGVSYQIMQTRAIATAKCQEDANMIAAALNSSKKDKRTIGQLKDQLQLMDSQKGINFSMLQGAFQAEAAALPNSAWSGQRTAIIRFYMAVTARLKRAIPE